MGREVIKLLSGVIVEEDQIISLAELCRYCGLPANQVIDMIDHGIIEPLESQATSNHWRFTSETVLTVQTVIRLQRDLDVNLAGAALVVELLDEVKQLRQMVAAKHY